jgi:hypothetical protein
MEREKFVRYRILAGMLRLRQFTVFELAHLTGVEPGSIRKFIERADDLVTRLGKQAPSGRGGRYIQYEVQPERLEQLRRDLDLLYSVIGAADQDVVDRELPREAPAAVGERHPLVTDLLVAEDLLLNAFPEAESDEEREQCIKAGTITFEGVGAALDGQIDRWVAEDVNAHLCLLDSLVRLAEAEVEVRAGASVESLAGDLDAITASVQSLPWGVIGTTAGPVASQIWTRIAQLTPPFGNDPLTRPSHAQHYDTSLEGADALRVVHRQELLRSLALPDVKLVLIGHKGRWVAIEGKQVIATAESAESVYAMASQQGVDAPLVFRVPDRPLMELL